MKNAQTHTLRYKKDAGWDRQFANQKRAKLNVGDKGFRLMSKKHKSISPKADLRDTSDKPHTLSNKCGKKYKSVSANIPDNAKSFKLKIKMKDKDKGDKKYKKWTMAEDDKYDKARGIKEGSPKDIKIDKSRGLKYKKAGVAFSPSKARSILKEPNPTLKGKPPTSKQRRWLGWQAGGAKKKYKKDVAPAGDTQQPQFKKHKKMPAFSKPMPKVSAPKGVKVSSPAQEMNRAGAQSAFNAKAGDQKFLNFGSWKPGGIMPKKKRKADLLSQMKKYKRGSGQAFKLFKKAMNKKHKTDAEKSSKKMMKERVKAAKQTGGRIQQTNWPFLKGETFMAGGKK